jgi:hypothetical protein
VVNGVKGAVSGAWDKYKSFDLKSKVGVAPGATALVFGEKPFNAIGLDPNVD